MDYQKAVYCVKTSERFRKAPKRKANKCIRTILGNTFIGDYEELDTALVEGGNTYQHPYFLLLISALPKIKLSEL